MKEHFRRETFNDPIMHQGFEGGYPRRGIPVQASLDKVKEAILRALHQLGKRLCPWDAQLATGVRTEQERLICLFIKENLSSR